MTCKQMGGPCDALVQANSAEEMMKTGGDHVNEMAEKGDEDHKKTKEVMDSAMTNPELMKAWQDKFMADYNALSE